MRKLLEEIIIPTYSLSRVEGGVGLPEMDDGATIPLDEHTLAVTMDAYTVKPIFFPGGDIGRLAACGTVNDLAAMGAKPLAFATSLVIEEGFPIEKLKRVLTSINSVLEEVGVPLIAGDTKVMERGKIDEIVVNACGIGLAKRLVLDSGLKPGNKLIVTGTIGDHEIALLTFREGIELEVEVESNIAPLWETVEAALEVGEVTAMKDPTRGGLAGALNEMAKKSGVDLVVREKDLPISEQVQGAVEILGLDPLESTNEGIMLMGVEASIAEDVLDAVRATEYGKDATIIGEVFRLGEGLVIMETVVGGKRLVHEPLGRPIPRIC